MDIWLMVSMSEEYFHSIQGSQEERSKELAEEEFKFWWLGEDLLKSASRIYSVRRFYGAERGGGAPEVPAFLVAFAYGALGQIAVAIVQYLTKYLNRNKDRELTIERGEIKLTLKGRSLPEEKELLRMLFPELYLEEPRSSDSR
jgi:hypothetical protein